MTPKEVDQIIHSLFSNKGFSDFIASKIVPAIMDHLIKDTDFKKLKKNEQNINFEILEQLKKINQNLEILINGKYSTEE